MQFSVALFSSLLSLASAAGDLALYWGQASAGSQQSLGDYCRNTAGDIYIISFITTFGSGRDIGMNIAGYYNFFAGTQILNAPALGEQIKTCQSLGKKVLISLGGAAGSYGFNSESDAQSVANDLWNMFGGGKSSTRPFGNAKIDGFDLDSENNIDAQYYVPFVDQLRRLYAKDPSKRYYVSAAPQCPFPDATLGQAVAKADLDFLFVQFYNNYCSLSGQWFNYDTWQSFASNKSPNKNVKVFVGLAGSTSAAGSGYVTIDQIKAAYHKFSHSPNFGGFMVWDASQADLNKVGGSTFGAQLKSLLKGSSPNALPSSSSSSSRDDLTTSSHKQTTATFSPHTVSGGYNVFLGYEGAIIDSVTSSTATVVTSSAVSAVTETVPNALAGSSVGILAAGGSATVTVAQTYVSTSSSASSPTSADEPPKTSSADPQISGIVQTSYETSSLTTSTTHGQPAQTTIAEANGENSVAEVTSAINTITNTPVAPTTALDPATTIGINSVVTPTNTVVASSPVAATPSPKVTSPAEESCYTTSGKVVVVKTVWATMYTTVWV